MGTGNEHFAGFVNGVEVARLRVGRLVQPTGYVGVPDLGGDALEIKHLEVAIDARCQRIGTAVIEELNRAQPGRRLVAFSREADGFWEDCLEWERYVDGSGSGVPLFVQRVRRPRRP